MMESNEFIDNQKKILEGKLQTLNKLKNDGELIQIEISDEKVIESIKKLKDCHIAIETIISHYMDVPNNVIKLVTSWIIGTYAYKEFETFPYLFINAMRGSGKTRLLKLIEALCWKGKITNNPSESVIFRDAGNCTLIIDECEGIGGRDKGSLRELLNSGYKKGSYVERMKKVKGKDGDEYKAERFHMYTPIALANIWGMEEVLGDRCVSLVLEKSSDPHKTRLLENFGKDQLILDVKRELNELSVVLCSVVTSKNILNKWNHYVDVRYTYTTTYTTITTLLNTNFTTSNGNDLILDKDEKELFDEIHDSNIDSRNLELFFPLFTVSRLYDNDIFKYLLDIAKQTISEKRGDEFISNPDISFIDFISKQESTLGHISVTELTGKFKRFNMDDSEDSDWLNSRWVGRALKRLGLVLHKRRLSKGIEVMIDVTKAKDKIRYFKEENND